MPDHVSSHERSHPHAKAMEGGTTASLTATMLRDAAAQTPGPHAAPPYTPGMSSRPLHWALRDLLSPRARRTLRRPVDALLARRLGSIRATGAADRFAVTFDDGPDGVVTPRLLDLLDRLDVKSTFFLLVTQCERHPDLAREISARGHEVALHGHDHRRITDFPTRQAAAAYLDRAKHELADATGAQIRLYRPPYGAQSVTTYRAARDVGLDPTVWTADVADWVDRPFESVISDARAALSPGGVLLFHERLEPDPLRDAPTTSFDRCAVVEEIVMSCRGAGLTPATVGSMVAEGGAVRSAWFRP